MKILIVRFSSIGDIVLCTPVFRWIKINIPQAEVHFLTKAKFKQVVNGNPYIDELIEWENPNQKAQMFGTDYDLIIDLHNNLRTRWVKLRFWGTPTRTLPKQNFQKMALVLSTKGSLGKWILSSRVIQRLFFGFSGDVHSVTNIVTRNLSLLENLGSDIKGWTQDSIVFSNAERELDFFVEPPQEQLDLPDDFAAVVLGGTYFTKQLPVELLVKIIGKLEGKIVLLGGPSEKAVAEKLNAEFNHTLLDFCGKLSLNDSAWVTSKSRVVVSGDTGMAHIAAALGVNLVMVWGNTIPEFGMVPPVKSLSNAHHFNVLGLGCRPCSKLGFDRCPQQHFACMQNQDSEAIRAAIEKYL